MTGKNDESFDIVSSLIFYYPLRPPSVCLAVCVSVCLCVFVSLCLCPKDATVVFLLVSLVLLGSCQFLIWPVTFFAGMCVYCLVDLLCLISSVGPGAGFFIAQFWDGLCLGMLPEGQVGWWCPRISLIYLPLQLVLLLSIISIKSYKIETNLLHSRSEFIDFVDKMIILISKSSWKTNFLYKKALFYVYSEYDAGLPFRCYALLLIRKESCKYIDFTRTHKQNSVIKWILVVLIKY